MLYDLYSEGRVIQVPGITVGNLEGVARVKLDTSGESPAYTLKPGIYDEFILPEKCGPGLGNAKPESLARVNY